MPDVAVVGLMVLGWAHGFLIGWAVSHRHEPFWHGFLDPFGLRRFRLPTPDSTND